MKYIVQYALPFVHTVQVGITAPDEHAALIEADRLFADGVLWDNSTAVPVLLDEMDEAEDSGPLTFAIAATISDEHNYPPADSSVAVVTRQNASLSLVGALTRLLACPDLNLDDLEAETQLALDGAEQALMAAGVCKAAL
jgi:glycine cleavage system regulatory protein